MRDIRYKLFNEPNQQLGLMQQVLLNRGIGLDEQTRWLNAGLDSMLSWKDLNDLDEYCGIGKMEMAVGMVSDAISNNEDVLVVVDSDDDGYNSGAIFINYFFLRYPEYTKEHIDFIMHKGKEHGLSDLCDEILARKPKLLVSPDGASNDFEQQRILNDAGIDVLVLDHHLAESDYTNDHTLIINVQLSKYPNKALTGGGVVYKFVSAFGEIILGEEDPVELMDMVAIANIGDMADYRENEIRALVNIGSHNIINPFFSEMCGKHKYTLEKRNGINYLSLAFAVVPFINALTRSGTPQEQEQVFMGMLTQYAYDKVDSSKRGFGGTKVFRYEEAVMVADRVKRRQDKIVNETFEHLEKRIENEHLADNAVIMLLCEPDEVEANHCGLLANKIQAKYQHPTLVLRKVKVVDSDEYVYQGSGRNFSFCPLTDMRGLCESTGLVNFAQGHQASFGMAIKEENVPGFIEMTNEAYSGIDFAPVYMVDYVWKPRDLTLRPNDVIELAGMDIWGQEMPQAKVAVIDIPLSANNVQLLGLAKGKPTIKIEIGGVEVMIFHASEELYDKLLVPNRSLAVVGTCSRNEWNGVVKPQILVDDYEIMDKWIF